MISSENGIQTEESFDGCLLARNITVMGRRTSVRLEPQMWQALKDISRREKCSVHALCSLIALRRQKCSSLTAAIRVFIMLYFRAASTDEGHERAGHGDLGKMMTRARVPQQAEASVIGLQHHNYAATG